MAKNSLLDYSTIAANNTDIGGIGVQGSNLVSNFDGAFRTLMAQMKSDLDYKQVYAEKTANYTAVANDNNAVLRFTSSATLSLTAAATLAANWHIEVIASGATVTIDPNGSELINGVSTLVLLAGDRARIICNGSAFIAVVTKPAWELIGPPVSMAGLDFKAWTDLSPYTMLRLRLDGVPLSSSGAAFIRVGSDNGSTWDDGSTDYYLGSLLVSGSTATANALNAFSYFALSEPLDNNVCAFSCEISSFNVAVASIIRCRSSYFASSTMRNIDIYGYRNSGTAHNALLLSTVNGVDWSSGTAVLEGIRG